MRTSGSEAARRSNISPATQTAATLDGLARVEVRSEDEYGDAAEGERAAKRADDFAAGARVAWGVDLLAATIVVYWADTPPGGVLHR